MAAESLIAAPPPPPRIADLIAEVTGAGLPHGTERSLLAKLENAQRKVDAGQIAVACLLGYLDLRFAGAWRATHPKLVAWLSAFSEAVPAFEATRMP